MNIDGVKLSARILQTVQNEITHRTHRPHLTVITCAPAFVTQKYLALKKKRAQAVGIAMNIIELPKEVTTQECVTVIKRVQMQTDAIVVQLPLPPQVDRAAVISAIPVSYDADALNYDGTQEQVLPPVVGAIAEIAHTHDTQFLGQTVLVLGQGLLVGKPAAVYAAAQGAQVAVATEATPDIPELLATADIIISGVGVPGLIAPEQVKDGVVIFDAGTSEDGGKLRGDAHPDCAAKASLFTPVPGGIGPLTIAMLLRNVLTLSK